MLSVSSIAATALFLLTLATSPAVYACTCIGGTFRDFYKQAPLVVKARVLRVTIEPTPAPSPCLPGQLCALPIGRSTRVEYKFRVRAVYKGCAQVGRLFRGRSVTGPFACGGILLRTNQVYMLNLFKPISGGKGRAYFAVGSCQGIKRFEDLSAQEKQFLRQRREKSRWGKCQ